MQCTVRWFTGKSFVAETASGHLIAMDGPPEGGGRNLAPRPMELLLAGTGGCTAYDVVAILEKSRETVTGCTVTLTAQRAESDPKVFTHIHIHYRIQGQQLDPAKVQRAIELSAEKYCSAAAMLRKSATIQYSWEIVDEAEKMLPPSDS
ncbi:MAG: OsmC family protein [Hydrogenophilus sp.]|nr:OsmC family protein [Hydrogenophilus sp.]